MVDYHSRPALLKHLSYNSPKCLQHIMQWYPPLNIEDIAALDSADLVKTRKLKAAGRTPTFSGRPASRLHGPLLAHQTQID